MTTAQIIQVAAPGGAETLAFTDSTLPALKENEVRVRHNAIGLNFIDVYHRTGLYPVPAPFTPGLEAAGVIEDVSAGVDGFVAGDRVAYCTGPIGAYSSHRNMPTDTLVKLPDAVSDEAAAALMLKATTVAFLIHETFHVKHGQTVLWHAAAGGVGLIACQWLKAKGVTVIGTVGGADKAALARDHGCTHTIDYTSENFTDRVREITGGAGVPVVYDSVGKATFDGSLDCLAPRGMMVSFGNATGAVDPMAPGILGQKGSLFLTRPSLLHYASARDDLVRLTGLVFDAVADGHITPTINQRFALRDAGTAHRALEGRETTGQSILLP
ncbi:quinone oxidoreductase family protein [Eilatimonas milleporae]|uniref:NADPH2:quinone reductase n=1 Tax=Eilatimonas milleporae TaxID=911205 RepID=A0A3M0BZ30_9PROT|nr:quinone oxidoreductase [Eilatimonas milleporae]RMB01845.1 NADPH2:quinone reductase [Eilatimonas milleporae]